MQVYLGSDHGGFEQKNALLKTLKAEGFVVTDCGSYSSASTDYPDFALAVGREVSKDSTARGILLCRSGEGMEIAANKIPKVRAALVWNKQIVKETRTDNDANILVLPSDYISTEEAIEMSQLFLTTPFSGEERHIRRLEKLHNIEHTSYES